jgi:hypothetical protein
MSAAVGVAGNGAGANVTNLALPVKIAHDPNRRANRRNRTTRNWRNYREIRGRCSRVTMEDGSIVYPYYEYKERKRANLLKTRRSAMRSVAFFTKKTFPDAPDGIYAWVYTNKGFFAGLVKSTTEHGTRHSQLADRVSATQIYMAGEIEKKGRNIIFNFYSGTYMYNVIENDRETEGVLEADALKLFRSMGLSATYGYKTEEIITATPSIEELRSYKDHGFDVFLHTTRHGCEIQRYEGRLPRRSDFSAVYEIENLDTEIESLEEKASAGAILFERVQALREAYPDGFEDILGAEMVKQIATLEESLTLTRAKISQLTAHRESLRESLKPGHFGAEYMKL